MANDYIMYSYIALALSKPALQDQEPILSDSLFTNNGIKWREPNKGNEEINNSVFNTILEDYLIGSLQLCIALDKFADRYVAAKSKSILRYFMIFNT
ncbi:9951_t:CDS:2 [Funneliformis mosseae]|uniref:9951_t:CDS:1 n=1 Tax=Funneliformis mosseae TaxID=27381 RepID=A0A9N9FAD2_FUNMO|nr:9951_t:CDS:2 [Funneliformis mosseae]